MERHKKKENLTREFGLNDSLQLTVDNSKSTSDTKQIFISFFPGESEVTQSCPTLCDPMDCSLPDSSVHGILQTRVLEWVVWKYQTKISRKGSH